ncbi:hypothetical protein TIFTF001_004613 [Ficus carica]|uniref:Uncharacterized protein n=1 Tax=Ficus carica TaxID=3494 RepID=A0AA88DD89_FICCA|nr:hypothetical protein TIFTF001_004613 [Ficus carica]
MASTVAKAKIARSTLAFVNKIQVQYLMTRQSVRSGDETECEV